MRSGELRKHCRGKRQHLKGEEEAAKTQVGNVHLAKEKDQQPVRDAD